MVGYVLVYLAVLHPLLENDFYGGGRDPQFMINQVNSLFLFAISFDFFCIVFDVNILCINHLCNRRKYNTNGTKTGQKQRKRIEKTDTRAIIGNSVETRLTD